MTCEEFAESLARNSTDEAEREALLLASLKQSGKCYQKCPHCGSMCMLESDAIGTCSM